MRGGGGSLIKRPAHTSPPSIRGETRREKPYLGGAEGRELAAVKGRAILAMFHDSFPLNKSDILGISTKYDGNMQLLPKAMLLFLCFYCQGAEGWGSRGGMAKRQHEKNM